MLRIKYRKQNQPRSSHNCEEDGADAQEGLAIRVIRRQASFVSKPSFRNERKIEYHHHRRTAGDEERFEECGANVRDVRNMLVGVHF